MTHRYIQYNTWLFQSIGFKNHASVDQNKFLTVQNISMQTYIWYVLCLVYAECYIIIKNKATRITTNHLRLTVSTINDIKLSNFQTNRVQLQHIPYECVAFSFQTHVTVPLVVNSESFNYHELKPTSSK